MIALPFSLLFLFYSHEERWRETTLLAERSLRRSSLRLVLTPLCPKTYCLSLSSQRMAAVGSLSSGWCWGRLLLQYLRRPSSQMVELSSTPPSLQSRPFPQTFERKRLGGRDKNATWWPSCRRLANPSLSLSLSVCVFTCYHCSLFLLLRCPTCLSRRYVTVSEKVILSTDPPLRAQNFRFRCRDPELT